MRIAAEMEVDKPRAIRLISHAVEATKTRWSQYDRTWRDIDRIFIHHGYEQGGFEIFKFLPLLDKRECYSIRALGSILREEDGPSYVRDSAGSLTRPFYVALSHGERGDRGRALYDAITDFQRPGGGRAGAFFWKLIWYILTSCRYLANNHSASFRSYMLATFAKHIGKQLIRDEELLSLVPEDWTRFVEKTRPWEPLKGIGRNTFDFIFGDLVEARFAQDLYKLDAANLHFLRVTGISDLIGDLDRPNVISFMRDLGTGHTLRQVNKGIYTYCSVTESGSYGFCRSLEDCKRCAVAVDCAKKLR